ncbi:hypothetical protein HGRIS_007913 [Hohenbuehelia grisea]|uniref:J domain-containing protein n=1 Tax=Hohenbuehelia grisea TaxID=104357 RepID=A0ABR3J6Q2_9AGAR
MFLLQKHHLLRSSCSRPLHLLRNASAHRFSSKLAGHSLCPSCSQPLPTRLPACTKCWTISPVPSTTSYHELLGLDEGKNPFIIDTASLKAQFRKSQSVCHPDSWTSKGSTKQNIAQSMSSLLNEAYRRLLHPLSRAEYILERNYQSTAEEDSLFDVDILSEIMEAREEIGSAEDAESLQKIMEDTQGKISETLQKLERTIENKDWETTKNLAVRLKYLEGVSEAAKVRLDAFP